MRKILAYLFLAAIVLLAGGCDFMRSLAGRPTSADIAAKRAVIEKFEQQKLASAPKDTVTSDTQAVSEEPVKAETDAMASDTKAPAKEERRSSLSRRCYIVVGAFSERTNAEKMVEMLAKSGFPATLINQTNGMTTVGACPTDDYAEAQKSLDALLGLSYVPDDAWILVKE